MPEQFLVAEKARITAAGGHVQGRRANGRLALSRALGDFEFKGNSKLPAEKQVITADPDILVHEISNEDEFLVLACDGIWDSMSSQDAVNFIRQKAYEGMELTEIAEFMCDTILAPEAATGRGVDNMTIVIVAILNGRTKEEWYTWIHDRVANGYGYPTPSEAPEIYSQDDIRAGRERARERRNEKYGELESMIDGDISDFALALNALTTLLDRGDGRTFAVAGNKKQDGAVVVME